MECADDRRGIIGAAVADDQNLEIGMRLVLNRSERTTKRAAPIVSSHNNAY
jgi:hypothetical protein